MWFLIIIIVKLIIFLNLLSPSKKYSDYFPWFEPIHIWSILLKLIKLSITCETWINPTLILKSLRFLQNCCQKIFKFICFPLRIICIRQNISNMLLHSLSFWSRRQASLLIKNRNILPKSFGRVRKIVITFCTFSLLAWRGINIPSQR